MMAGQAIGTEELGRRLARGQILRHDRPSREHKSKKSQQPFDRYDIHCVATFFDAKPPHHSADSPKCVVGTSSTILNSIMAFRCARDVHCAMAARIPSAVAKNALPAEVGPTWGQLQGAKVRLSFFRFGRV